MRFICPICKTKLVIDYGHDEYCVSTYCNNNRDNNKYHQYGIVFYKNKIIEYFIEKLLYNVYIYHEMENRKCKTTIYMKGQEKSEFDKYLINFYSETLDADIKKLLLLL